MAITNEMYSKLPNLVLGFHGCKEDTFKSVIYNHEQLKPSTNTYDWLGNGIYFWDNSYERAMEWAAKRYGESGRVVGAVIDLGCCLNLTDYSSTSILQDGYKVLEEAFRLADLPVPQNTCGRSKTDVLLRNLDCAVIQYVHKISGNRFDSVRGVFTEGAPIYPGAALVEKTHIQICVANPNCIKGYFSPLDSVDGFPIP